MKKSLETLRSRGLSQFSRSRGLSQFSRSENGTVPLGRPPLPRPLGRYRYVRLRWRVLFTLIDTLGYAAAGLAARIRRLLGRRRRAAATAENDDPRVILLVQLDHLGDAIISTAILPSLRSRYPAASIEVLAGPWNRELFEAMPEVDRVHVSRVNRFARSGFARFAWTAATFWWGLRLRERKVDLGVDLRGEFPIALMLWLCGARRRLGWACGGGGFLLSDTADFLPGRPEVESRWALIARLGIRPPDDPRRRQPRFEPPAIGVRGSGIGVRGSGIGVRESGIGVRESGIGGLVVLHVGAGTPAKQWPAAYWRELLGRIIVAHGPQVVLVGSGKDCKIATEILGSRRWPGVEDCTGRLNVAELAAVLRRADVLVGADSAPAHLAAAVGTPVVVLFSGTNDPLQWKPCGRAVTVLRHAVACSPCHRERCPRRGHPCMSGLRPRQVAAAVDRICGKGVRL